MPEMSFDGKSTLSYWGLELVRCTVSSPKRKKYEIDIPAGDGLIDAMRGLGDPVYEMRTLTATFNVPSTQRRTAVTRILSELEGRDVAIVTPDDPNSYWFGEVHLQATSASQLTIVATVYPWRYANVETVIVVPASAAAVQHTWHNGGTRAVVPELEIADRSVTISAGEYDTTLPAGKYDLSELKIPGNGTIALKISGGSLTARYREANLL